MHMCHIHFRRYVTLKKVHVQHIVQHMVKQGTCATYGEIRHMHHLNIGHTIYLKRKQKIKFGCVANLFCSSMSYA